MLDSYQKVRYTRSSAGQTAELLDAAEKPIVTCHDNGAATDADGAVIFGAAFMLGGDDGPGRAKSDVGRLKSYVNVVDAAGAAVGRVTIKKYSVGPFKRKFVFGLLDASGAEIGELATTDKKGTEFDVSIGGQVAISATQSERDRGIARSAETWVLTCGAVVASPSDLTVVSAILRFNKIISELVVPD